MATERREGYPVPQGAKAGLPTPRFADPDVQRMFDHLNEVAGVLTGTRGDPRDMVVTWRTMEQAVQDARTDALGVGAPDIIPEAFAPERIYVLWPSFDEGPPAPETSVEQDTMPRVLPRTGLPAGEDWAASPPRPTTEKPAIWQSERHPVTQFRFSKFSEPINFNSAPPDTAPIISGTGANYFLQPVKEISIRADAGTVEESTEFMPNPGRATFTLRLADGSEKTVTVVGAIGPGGVVTPTLEGADAADFEIVS